MKFQFNPNQQYQLNAISAVMDLFKGQTISHNTFGVTGGTIGSLEKLPPSKEGLESLYGNNLTLNNKQINNNLKTVQETNQIFSPENVNTKGKNFTVEMETGTGKTYVYLRTIFELNKEYGFSKFIIVVPSVAIREGVLKSMDIMKSHFKELYNNIAYVPFIYQSKKISLLRNFARGNDLQIMVINIDAFNKDKNIIHEVRDQIGGIKPIEFIKNIKPIVIIDEPQNMESEKSREAIKSLNPLCTLRYSATHRNLYNPIYRLDPVQAFQKKLVKKISVASLVEENDPTSVYLKVLKITNKNNKITSQIEFFKNTNTGRKLVKKVCKQNDDLFISSEENPIYKNGFKINEISCKPGNKFVRFSNGLKIAEKQEQGGFKEELIKAQFRKTIETHFEKEIQLKKTGIKVLSLFFLDRVENYRVYNSKGVSLGTYGKWFEEIYKELSKKYKKDLDIIPVSTVHNGYFSKDRKGQFKNTTGNTKEDTNTYNLIMKEKEKLLNINNPLKFIFTHSALREGWDNPNIFQICTLSETRSTLKKRQEIGRGLRLPVSQKGERVQDDLINNLVVVANESYDSFVNSLQKEFEEECGFTFGSLPISAFVGIAYEQDGKEHQINLEESKAIWKELKELSYLSNEGVIEKEFAEAIKNNRFSISKNFKNILNEIIYTVEQYQSANYIRKYKNKRKAGLNKRTLLDPEFKKFWSTISKKTFYNVCYSSKDLIQKASTAIHNMESIQPIKISISDADIELKTKGIEAHVTKTPEHYYLSERNKIPDILSYIQDKIPITRRTIFEILDQSKRLNDFISNPQKFMDLVIKEIRIVLNQLIIEGIKYEKLDKESYEMSRFKDEEHIMEFIDDKVIPTEKSIYDYIYYESNPEKNFAKALENMRNIKYFIKLPNWFKVSTPVGEYNPDWAILKQNGDIVYMIRETKSSLDKLGLRSLESKKIQCGKAHFESIGVNYKACTSIDNADL